MAGIVSLADVKAHLRYPTADVADDSALAGFISAASDVIDTETGICVPKQYEESYSGGDFKIWLAHIPVISVENVIEGWGFINQDLSMVQANSPNTGNLFAFSVDEPETGEISRRTGGNINIPFNPGVSNILITYTAGRTTIPGAIRLAALELIAHWWQSSQQRAGGGTGVRAYDAVDTDFTRTTGVTGFNQGVPYRIIEILRPFRRFPIIG